jgi:hypothetical protein
MALKVRVGEQVMSLGEDRLEMRNASGGQSMFLKRTKIGSKITIPQKVTLDQGPPFLRPQPVTFSRKATRSSSTTPFESSQNIQTSTGSSRGKDPKLPSFTKREDGKLVRLRGQEL